MPVEGTPAFNAIAILEIEGLDFRSGPPAVTAHAAFVSTKSGKTYGSTTCRVWSKQTIELIDELRRAMEEDIAALVFDDERSPERPPRQGLSGPGGLAEHLDGDVRPI